MDSGHVAYHGGTRGDRMAQWDLMGIDNGIVISWGFDDDLVEI